MEGNFAASAGTEQDSVEVDDYNNNDGNDFGGERCGICMDIVIDRGVLDCCQHWFCFGCIDNWATITNLCPLCQTEFQLITCVPVYDTIGSSKVDEDSYSRDDDWFVEGKNNTLSFPSYYIDENAVICLDGDGCKIRNGSASAEGDSNLDTSIACDSCDIWYHAFCVGFDPEGTSESTWLCPRCVVDEMPQEPDRNSVQNYNNPSGPQNANKEQLAEDTYARKVSISVADSGETAIVVSMVEGNRLTEKPLDNNLSTVEVDKELKTQAFILSSEDISQKPATPSEERSVTKPILKTQELELSLSCETSRSFSSHSLIKRELITSDTPINDYSGSSSSRSSLGEVANASHISKNPFDSISDMGLNLGLSVGSFLSVDKANKNVAEDQIKVIKQPNPMEDSLPIGDSNRVASKSAGVKRKYVDSSVNACDHIHVNASGEAKTEIRNEISPKKMRADEKIELIMPDDQVNDSASDVSEIVKETVPGNAGLKYLPEKENGAIDIMNIVQGTKRRPPKRLRRLNADEKTSKELESSAGLRVKKIMKRAGEDNESSMVVQKLRKEIREAVRNKSVKDLGENLFDPKLLAAFRVAVAGPKTESVKTLSQLAVKARKSMLQKGKVRENLTKKIYASNGRRKRAWDRDCEVEFWKYRCARASRPEKIQTLKSVLDLLRSGSESTETGQQSERQATDPILSRLYLADTSVFPRKDDIKPLAALRTSGDSELSNKQPTLAEKRLKLSLDNSSSQVNDRDPSKVLKKNIVTSLNVSVASSKVPLSRNTEGSSLSALGSSKSTTHKEAAAKSDDIKIDKRKWALEVLARRTSGVGDGAANGKQEDNAVLKGHYPLLAQLPVEMRPVLAPSRHNKIPISVRQAQLYRLTEHLLRKANLPVIRRTAETELAVADAVNIEREVADRSSSKLVYMNLCSQELLHRSENSKSRGAAETTSSMLSTDPVEGSEKSEIDLSNDPVVQEALKNAGLLSDSPPNSPNHGAEVQPEEGEPSTNSIDEGPEDVFEIDDVPDLDIYGEFEYSLDDEDYIGVSATKVSKIQAEENASKMKVVFSTLQSEKSSNTMDSKNPESFGNADADTEVPNSSSTVLKTQNDTGFSNPTMAGETETSCVPQELLYGKEGEELSIAECEELYGPDKDPLMKKLPEEGSMKLYGLSDSEAMPNQAEKSTSIGRNSSAGENSPNRSETGETVQNKEKKSKADSVKPSDNSISKKVEAYVKEHIRPLCKSGVITADQYRWAVAKATEKVMKYHCKAKNANFLIKEGEKVKKLAEQYVEAAKQKE